jgi:hypothetical protein
VRDTIPGESGTAGVHEDRLVGRPAAHHGEALEGGEGLTPERAQPFFPSLAAEPDVRGATGLDVLDADVQGFADAGTGVVEEEQQGVVALPASVGAIGLLDEMSHRLWLEVRRRAGARPFRRECQDPLVLLGPHRVMACQVPDKAANRREPTVACGRGVAPLGLQVRQECRDGIDVEILWAQGGHRTLRGVSQKHEEEIEGVAVREDGVSARSAHVPEVLAEERLDELRIPAIVITQSEGS